MKTFLLGIGVALLAVALWGAPWNWDPDYNRIVTIQQLSKARGFDVTARHRVCSWDQSGDDGTWRFELARAGNSCRQIVAITLPSEQVTPIYGARSSWAVAVYNRHVYFRDYIGDGVLDWRSPNSGGKHDAVSWVLSHSQAQVYENSNLKVVVLRLAQRAPAAKGSS